MEQLPSLVETIVSVATGAFALVLVYFGKKIWGKVNRVLDQTENTHCETEYPNMRDEITAIRLNGENTAEAQLQLAKSQEKLAQAVEKLDDKLERREEAIRNDMRQLSNRLDLHMSQQS